MNIVRKLLLILLLPIIVSACQEPGIRPSNFNKIDPIRDDVLVNMVIEIPAGSNQKWEVNKETGKLEWEQIGDSLRVINYLSYPANYGMVPGTYLPKDLGGDDDPLDVFLLGPAVERGTVQSVKVIGAIKILDRGEQDDKLVAVDPKSWFGHIHSMDDLENSFPGVISILVTWLQNYKGSDKVVFQGIEDAETAHETLAIAIKSFSSKTE